MQTIPSWQQGWKAVQKLGAVVQSHTALSSSTFTLVGCAELVFTLLCAAGLCQRVPARLATKQELLRVHTPDHLHRLQLFCSGQVPPSAIPSDTYINQHTLQCAALAAGSAAEVAVRVYQGEASCGAAIIRPPGHHAESNTGVLDHKRC